MDVFSAVTGLNRCRQGEPVEQEYEENSDSRDGGGGGGAVDTCLLLLTLCRPDQRPQSERP